MASKVAVHLTISAHTTKNSNPVHKMGWCAPSNGHTPTTEATLKHASSHVNNDKCCAAHTHTVCISGVQACVEGLSKHTTHPSLQGEGVVCLTTGTHCNPGYSLRTLEVHRAIAGSPLQTVIPLGPIWVPGPAHNYIQRHYYVVPQAWVTV